MQWHLRISSTVTLPSPLPEGEGEQRHHKPFRFLVA